MVVTGSPGTIRSMIKISSTTPTRTGMEIRIRFSTFLNTLHPPLHYIGKESAAKTGPANHDVPVTAKALGATLP